MGLGRWGEALAHQPEGGAREECAIIEEGCGGRTTVWDDPLEMHKNGRTYLLPCLHSHRPLDAVVIALGTNDLKCRFSLTSYDIAQERENWQGSAKMRIRPWVSCAEGAAHRTGASWEQSDEIAHRQAVR